MFYVCFCEMIVVLSCPFLKGTMADSGEVIVLSDDDDCEDDQSCLILEEEDVKKPGNYNIICLPLCEGC